MSPSAVKTLRPSQLVKKKRAPRDTNNRKIVELRKKGRSDQSNDRQEIVRATLGSSFAGVALRGSPEFGDFGLVSAFARRTQHVRIHQWRCCRSKSIPATPSTRGPIVPRTGQIYGTTGRNDECGAKENAACKREGTGAFFVLRPEGSEIEIIGWSGRVSCRLRSEFGGRIEHRAAFAKGMNRRSAYFREFWRVATPVRRFLQVGENPAGPTIVESSFSTVVIDPGASASRTASGSLIIFPNGLQ